MEAAVAEASSQALCAYLFYPKLKVCTEISFCIRCVAILKVSALISKPIKFLFSFLQTIAVVPEPMNVSKIKSPSLELLIIICLISFSGFSA